MHKEGEPQPVEQPIATNWVHRDDLLSCRPDLEEKIKVLSYAEIERIASKVGDALSESYWMALETILDLELGQEAREENGLAEAIRKLRPPDQS